MRKFFFIYAMIIIPFSLLSAQDSGLKNEENDKKSAYSAENKQSDEVVVRGEAFNVNKSAFTVNTVGSDEIKKKKISKSAEVVLEVPGVEVKNYNQGGVSNAISMRGFTTGFHSGDTAAYLDGMSLNEFYGSSGGQSNPNVIVPIEIDNVQVFKGPSSVLYGNYAKSGAVVYNTKQRGEYTDILTIYGSNKTIDLQGATGHRMSESLWNNTSFQVFKTDGHTANSDELYGTAATSFTFDINKDLEVNAAFRGHRDVWNISGYMTKAEYDSVDKYDFYNGKNDGGDRGFYSAKGSVKYQAGNSLRFEIDTYRFKSDFTRFYSSSSASQQTETIRNVDKTGGVLKAIYKTDFITLTTGADYTRNEAEALKYNTLIRVRQGSATGDEDSQLDNYGVFAEAVLDIHPLFRPVLGARYDMFVGEYDNNLTPAKSGDFSATDFDHVSPKIGFTSEIIEEFLQLRGSVSNGFVLPNQVLYSDNKQKESEIWQYDAGVVISRKWLMIDLGGFILTTTNELKEDPVGSGEYKTSGKTRRIGFESAAKIKPASWLELSGKFSWIDSEILENPDDALVSKSINGIPRTSGNIGFIATSPAGIGCKARWSHTGKYYLDTANQDEYSGFNLLDAGIFYTFGENGKEGELAFDVKNVFDKEYASSASSTSWAVGPPRTYWISYSMKW